MGDIWTYIRTELAHNWFKKFAKLTQGPTYSKTIGFVNYLRAWDVITRANMVPFVCEFRSVRVWGMGGPIRPA